MKSRYDKLYIFDINRCREKIEIYLNQVTEGEFPKNEMMQDAIVRNIEKIGDVSKKTFRQNKRR